MFVVLMLISLLFAVIDFGRAIYDRQVLVKLSREGANLVSRFENPTNTLNALIQSDDISDFSSRGSVIISTLTLNTTNNTVEVRSQYGPAGVLAARSRIGQTGGRARLPANPIMTIPQPDQNLYAVEVFYSFQPVTPVGQLLNLVLPSELYDVAFF
jgi:Flp pilus assembly protein TadG